MIRGYLRAPMIRTLILILALTSTSYVAAIASQISPPVLHERRTFNPEERGWRFRKRLEPDAVLPLRLGLAHQNLHTLEEELNRVSHPESAEYGRHWSVDRVVKHFSPSDETINLATDWLSQNNIDPSRAKLSNSRSWLDVTVTVEEAERLLKTEYHVYDDKNGEERVGCSEYHIPAHLTPHIDLIKPTTAFNTRVPPAKFQKRSSSINSPQRLGSPSSFNGPKTNGQKVDGSTTLGLADCDQFITPICLQTLYNINASPVATDKNTFGVVEFTPQAFLQGDLDLFFHNFSTSQIGQTPQLVSIDGGVAQTTNQSFDFNGESDLDLEYAMVLTNPQPVTLLQTGDLVEGAGFDNWLDAVDASFCTFEGMSHIEL